MEGGFFREFRPERIQRGGELPRVTDAPSIDEVPRRPRVTDAPRLDDARHPLRGRAIEATAPVEKSRELAPARRVELKVGYPDRGGVTRETVKLDSSKRRIVIDRSRGVLIGDRTRQLNDYRYKMVRPHVSLDRLFDGHPARERAFEGLVAKPDSIVANYVFRHQLSKGAGPLYVGGRLGSGETSGPHVSRIPVRLDERGAIVVSKSWGVKVGDGGTQRNQFIYTLKQPEFHIEGLLADRPDLVRRLAVAAKYPDSRAAQRSFANRLTGACAEFSVPVRDLHTQYPGAGLRAQGDGVHLGADIHHIDKISIIRVNELVLTGWEEITDPRSEQANAHLLDQRLQRGHQDRISMSRPSGFTAVDQGRRPEGFTTRLIRRAAKAILDQVAPDRDHLVPRAARELAAGLDNLQPIDGRSAFVLDIFGATWESTPRFWVGETVGRVSADDQESLPIGGLPPARSDRTAQFAHLEVVELGDQKRAQEACENRAHGASGLGVIEVTRNQELFRSISDRPGGLPSAERQSTQAGAASQAVSAVSPANGGDDDNSAAAQASTRAERSAARSQGIISPVGAVLCGSAASIATAAGTGVVDAEVLLAYVRQRIWSQRYDGTPESVVPSMRVVQALEVVIFLDPWSGWGLWIDVDPALQVVAASLLIAIDLSTGPPGQFRVFAHRTNASAQAVMSAMRP